MAPSSWFDNPRQLVLPGRLAEFFPSMSLPFDRRLDAASRLAIYYALVILIVKRDPTVMVFLLAFLAVLFAFDRYYRHQARVREQMMDRLNQGQDTVSRKPCFKPTRDNPFMNVVLTDNPDRPPSCDMTKRSVQKQVESLFDQTAVYNADDVFRRNSGQRQFYSMPATTTPNDQDAFAKWLYKDGRPTCKESSDRCEPSFRVVV
jgi:hypothetical protein